MKKNLIIHFILVLLLKIGVTGCTEETISMNADRMPDETAMDNIAGALRNTTTLTNKAFIELTEGDESATEEIFYSLSQSAGSRLTGRQIGHLPGSGIGDGRDLPCHYPAYRFDARPGRQSAPGRDQSYGCIFGHGPAGNRCGIGELRFRTIQVPVRFARTACHRIIQGKATGHERQPVSGG